MFSYLHQCATIQLTKELGAVSAFKPDSFSGCDQCCKLLIEPRFMIIWLALGTTTHLLLRHSSDYVLSEYSDSAVVVTVV